MTETRTASTPPGARSDGDLQAQQLAEENQRLRDALEGILIILGNPEGYCDNDRTEVAQAVAEAERGLGRRPAPVWRRLHDRSESGRAAARSK